MVIEAKRFTSDPLYLMWKLPGSDAVDELTVIREDLHKIQNLTWQEFSLKINAAKMLGLQDKKKPKTSGRITVEQHKNVRDSVRHRTETGEIHDLAGTTTTDAGRAAILERNRKWDEQTAAALGREKRQVAPLPEPPPALRTPAEAEYDEWLKARKAERDDRRRGAENV